MTINALYDSARGGDKAAREQLFNALSARFRVFAERKIRNRVDSDEVVQDALLVVTKKYQQLEVKASFAAWAHDILNKEILRYYRKKGLREQRFGDTLDIDGHAAPSEPGPELKRRLIECMRKIVVANPRYARILNLHYQGYTIDEVCQKLNVSPNNSYTILSRARTMLEKCLNKGELT